MGTTHLPACPWEKFRLNSTAGSLSHCWVPVLQISCESRFYKPRKSKHFPVHKRKVSRVIKWDKMVSEALSEAPCYISNTSRSKTLSFSHAKVFSNILTGFFLISGTDVTDRQHLGNSNDAHLWKVIINMTLKWNLCMYSRLIGGGELKLMLCLWVLLNDL